MGCCNTHPSNDPLTTSIELVDEEELKKQQQQEQQQGHAQIVSASTISVVSQSSIVNHADPALEKNFDEMQQIMVSRRSVYDDDGKQIESMATELEALKTELTAVQKEKDMLETSYAKSASKSYKNYKKNKDKPQNDKKKKSKESTSMESNSQMLQMSQQLDILRKENESLKQEIESKNNDLENRLLDIRREYMVYKAVMETQSDNPEKLRGKVQELKKEIELKTFDVKHRDDEIGKLRAELTKHKLTIEADKEIHRQEVKSLHAKISDLESNHHNNNDDLNGATSPMSPTLTSAQSQEFETLKEENQRLRRGLSDIHQETKKTKEEYRNELELLKQKDPDYIAKILSERDEMRKELESLKKQRQETEFELKSQLTTLEKDKDKDIENEISKIKEKYGETTNSEVNELAKQLETSFDTNRQLRLDITKQEKEYQEQIKALQKVIQNLKERTSRKPTLSAGVSKENNSVDKEDVSEKEKEKEKGKEKEKEKEKENEKKEDKKSIDKSNAAGALNNLFASRKGGDTNKNEKSNDDAKSKLGAMFAARKGGAKDESATTKSDSNQKSLNEIIGKKKGGESSEAGKDDKFAKYTRMLKIGLPEVSVRNKMKMDGLSETEIAQFFGDPLPESSKTSKKKGNAIDLSKHDLSKYDKMKKIGMPEVSIRNKMKMDGIDAKVIATYFGDAIEDDNDGDDDNEDGGVIDEPPGGKPDLTKYEKMQKVGLPPPSIRNKMIQDKIDQYWICTFFGDPLPKKAKKSGSGGASDEPIDPPPGGKPDLAKYERMKKVGLPPPSIRSKMIQDKIHEYWICTFFGDPLPRKGGGKGGKGGKGKAVKRKVKPLHWRKKSDCKWDETLWGSLDKFTPDNVFNKEFQDRIEQSFAIVEKKKKAASDKKKVEKKEPEEISILDGKRSFSMIVGLKAFQKAGMSDQDIRDAMLKLDDTNIDVEMLQNLQKFVPTNEELRMVREFKGDRGKLARGEQFVDVLTVMTDIKLRLELWQFKLQFKEKIGDLDERVTLVHTALGSLKDSEQLQSFFGICLAFGNFMNEGTSRGNAKGFHLDTIDRLQSLRTAEGDMNMLMFIIKFIQENRSKEFEGFPGNLKKTVEAAKKIESKSIRDGIGDMKDALERIGKRIARANRNLKELHKQFGERVSSVLAIFAALQHKGATLKATRIAQEMHDSHETYENVAKRRLSSYFGSSPRISGNMMHKLTDQALIDTFALEDDDMIDHQATGDFLDQESGEIQSDAEFDSVPATPRKIRVKFSDAISSPQSQKSPVGNYGKVNIESGDKKEKDKDDLTKHSKMNSVARLMADQMADQMSQSSRGNEEDQSVSTTKTFRDKLNLKNFISSANPFKKKKKNVHPLDRFEKVMTGFHTLATNHIENCENDYQSLKDFAGTTALFFGEPDDLEWENLFKMFLKFFETYEKSCAQLEKLKKQKEKEERAKERERKKQEKAAKKGKRVSTRAEQDKITGGATNILEEIKFKSAAGTLKSPTPNTN